jgi:GNAT superfamily N-acetyltransferase
MDSPHIEYIADTAVDGALDRALRELLVVCFTGPQDAVFREHRHFIEPPHHRWFVRGERGDVIAHVAVHDKVVVFAGARHRIGGIADVAVHPEYRGRGYVRRLLATAHTWLAAHGFEYAVLFGDPEVYTSSGYVPVMNLFQDATDAAGQPCRRAADGAMVAPLAGRAWPVVEVYLPGQKF